jgi:hypothetical protein
MKYSTKCKIENNDEINASQDLCNHSTIEWKFHKKTFLIKFSFACITTFVVQNLPARGRKTEKNKELA